MSAEKDKKPMIRIRGANDQQPEKDQRGYPEK